MPDLPDSGLLAPYSSVITVASPACVGFDAAAIGGVGAAASVVWPAANRAYYFPFLVERTIVATKMSIEVGTQAGNLDMGLYDENFARLVSLGSTAVGAAGLQVGDITDTTLTPGLYYMAMNCSSATAAFFRLAPSNFGVMYINGVVQEDVGAVALPATATPAAVSSPYIPCLAVAMKATH